MRLAADPGLRGPRPSQPPQCPSCESFTALGGSPEPQKLPPEAGMAVSCLLGLSVDKFPQGRLRGQHLPPRGWALLDTQKKLGGVGQREVKVCSSPVSSAIDPAGFFLGGGADSALFSLLNLALPQREHTCSLHPVCKEGVQLLEVARLEKLERCHLQQKQGLCWGQFRWDQATSFIVVMMSLDCEHMTFIVAKYT